MTSEIRIRGARTTSPEPGDGRPTGRRPRDGRPSAERPSGEARPRDLRVEVEPHRCFACGSLSEHGMRLDLHVSGESCWTELELADRFQGWDGIAHGGIVCTILDEVMAWSLASSDNWGMTARMTVDFKRPVRLGVPIRAEGWMTRRRRRLVDTAARLVDGTSGELLATAEAVYVPADEERRRELMARYRFRLAPASGAGDGEPA